MSEHEVKWCFHTTAMVVDYERTRDALVRLVGLRVLEDSRLEHPGLGRRGGMAWVGDGILEIGEPIVEGGAVDRFVRRFGSHMSSIALQVTDIDATVARLEMLGVGVGSRPDHDIVFTTPSETAGVLFEWFGGQPTRDPRYGGVVPQIDGDSVLDVRQVAFAGAVVASPTVTAHRFASLFQRGVTFDDPSADTGHPAAGVSTGDCTLALFPLPPTEEESERLWGWKYQRAQASCIGVLVPDLAAASHALTSAAIDIVREDDRFIVVHPSATGGVTVVVTDRLLPGDPRSTGVPEPES